jgi:hypothetical protein
MLTEQTVERLRSLRLGAIAEAYLAQQRDASAATLSFDERLGMLVDAEQLARENRALTRPLKEAKLRLSPACLEDLDYSGRKLDRALIRQLATCQWVAEHHNILITGSTRMSAPRSRSTELRPQWPEHVCSRHEATGVQNGKTGTRLTDLHPAGAPNLSPKHPVG